MDPKKYGAVVKMTIAGFGRAQQSHQLFSNTILSDLSL
jgi:hypothetical protein